MPRIPRLLWLVALVFVLSAGYHLAAPSDAPLRDAARLVALICAGILLVAPLVVLTGLERRLRRADRTREATERQRSNGKP